MMGLEILESPRRIKRERRTHGRASRFVALAKAAMLVFAPASAQVPPAGWRFALSSDSHIDADRVTLESSQARADFDGNGTLDQAAILVRQSESGLKQAVFAFLMRADGEQDTHALKECAASCGEVALAVTRPGCIKSDLTNETVCLQHAGLALFEIEFGTGNLYWYADGKWNEVTFSPGEFPGVPF
jgi:hypothetical protein